MAARSKKKGDLARADQESKNRVNTDEKSPAAGNGNDGANMAAEVAEPHNFVSDLSGGKMNMEMGSPEAGPSDEATGDADIAPALELDANLSIQNVAKLHEKLKKIYAVHDAIEIDASHVASVDTAALQLFAALKKDALKQNKTVDFFQPSPRFVESARLLGLLDMLEIIDV